MKIVLYAVCCFGLAGSVASAQVCQATNASLNGAYGFVANQLSLGTAISGTGTTTGTGGTTTTGTTTSSSGFSTTVLGQLLGGIAANNQFTLAGRLIFDGAGHIDAQSTTGLGSPTQVGTYNVNPNCTITVTLMDAFGTNTATTTFAGVVLGGGSEIDLEPASSSTTTTGTTSTGGTTTTATQFGSGLTIKLIRILLPYGCSDSNLTGLYGFVLTGVTSQNFTTTPTGTGTTTGAGTTSGTGTTTGVGSTATVTTLTGPYQPFTLIGTLLFDGAGHIVATQPALNTSAATTGTTTGTTTTSNASITVTPLQISLAGLQYTGTYTVNSDCSGTLTLTNTTSFAASTSASGSSPGTTTGTGTGTTGTGTTSAATPTTESFTASFVLTQPNVTVANGTNLNNYRLAPELEFTTSGSSEIASGYALPE